MHKSQATRCHPLCPDFIKYKYFPFRWGYVGLNGDRRQPTDTWKLLWAEGISRETAYQARGLKSRTLLKSGLSREQETSAGSLEAVRKIKTEDELVKERERESRHFIADISGI